MIGGYIEIKFKMNPSNHPVGILWMNPLGSFTILIKMHSQYAWATHWEFFQNIPSYLISMYSTIYSMSFLRVCGKIEPHWEFVVSFLKGTYWVHYGHIFEYSLKETSMSGSGTLWVHFDQNCERAVLSSSGACEQVERELGEARRQSSTSCAGRDLLRKD